MATEPSGLRLEVEHPPMKRPAHNRLDLPAAEVVGMYLNGASEKRIAESIGISRGPIRRILIAAGVPIRGRSESMYLRMEQTPAAERARLTEAAHNAVRGTKHTDDMRRRRAQAESRRRGPGEAVFAAALRKRGYSVKEQAPIDFYNIDLLCGDVAVELRCSPGNPMKNPDRRARTEHLLGRGVVTLWIYYRDLASLVGCIDQAIAHLDEIRGDPAARSQHRVIRCATQRFARVRSQLGQFAVVPTSVSYSCRRVE